MSNRSRPSAAAVVAAIADLAAILIGLWILLYILDANRSNDFVDFVHDVASWLAGWSRDMFTVDPDWWQVMLNYGLAAVVYLAVGHAASRAVRRW
ncbi:hypothetical protein O7599_20945 [Streptomyces sp. WMMC500]|uniref:hypothetical protein n=1 Tax=Streptomyces sp. WMMC500 TaxID=3015154 RepID=UPI00248B35F6|nr:hypothetical protein [Streptomyces sp. WMMC500]WBB58114.1 hypothetical protein O7599_20945 [Streptomyces sp. WMMC500]